MNPLTTMMITEKENPTIQSTRSRDSGRTVLYPDLDVLTNDEHRSMTPEAHKYAAAAAAAGSFCFVTTENEQQQDIYHLKLNSRKELAVKPETCWNAVWPPVEKQQEQGPRGGYYNQFAEAKHLEYKSWVDNEFFDLMT